MKKGSIWIIALAICFSLVTFAPIKTHAAQVVDQTGLLAYWNLDEGTGTTSKEITGILAGRDLSVKGTSQWVDGKNGKAFYFDGNTVLTMDGAKTILTDNLTVSLWAKIDGFPTSDNGANSFMVNSDLSALDKGAFDFGFFGKGLKSYVVNNFAGGTGDGINHGVDISADILGKWQHFAVVYNQDEGAEYAKLYLNGTEVKSSKLTSILGLKIKLGYPKTAAYKKCDFNIGGYVDTAGVVIRSIKGAMDDIAVYGRVLSADEIKLLSTGVRPNQTASSTVSSSTAGSSSKVSSITSSKTSLGNSTAQSSITDSNASSEIFDSTINSESDSMSSSGISSEEDSESNSNETTSGTSSIPIIIGIIALVLVIAGGAYYLVSRKNKNRHS